MKNKPGEKIGFITVLEEGVNASNRPDWKCLCECGVECRIDADVLRRRAKYLNCGQCRTQRGSHKFGDLYENVNGTCYKLISITGKHCVLEDFQARRFGIRYSNLISKTFKNPWEVSVAGVGYFGVGEFIAKESGKHTTEYSDWNSMLKRCYVDNGRKTYKDVSVCESWHNFQNFAKWARSAEFFGEVGYALDKDLLKKHNKVYSPDTCCYIPAEINSFIRRNRMNDLPLGVDISHKYDGTLFYRAQAREGGRNIMLGGFYSVESAFLAYKTHKEGLSKVLAEKWKDKISEEAYAALKTYTVEITD